MCSLNCLHNELVSTGRKGGREGGKGGREGGEGGRKGEVGREGGRERMKDEERIE